MRGVGADLEPASIPSVPALLVNPLVPAATGAVYRAFDAFGGDGALTDPGPVGDDLVAWLARTRNDLTAAALSVAPAIAGVMAALRDAAPGGLVRLSGSGATCFALFPDARWRGAVGRPEWWVRATTLGPVDVRVRDDYRPGGDAGARA
jgi:4-diphosphocytidyl-2-C-methyl-D-erythritol kinase